MNKKKLAGPVVLLAVIVLDVAGEQLLTLPFQWWMQLNEAIADPPRAGEILQRIPASGWILWSVIAAGLVLLFGAIRLTSQNRFETAAAPCRNCQRTSIPRPRHLPRRLRRRPRP